ncbi:hypothetical protein [Kitasatospora sp. NPDC050463]|uniref:hypothetical protein n=1 Tax=Kitasatospora sp. NPDC050463 TaxID=3155786 RepID=UPI0033DE4DE6
MTKPHQSPVRVCAGPRCGRLLPAPAATGRPGFYCGQACRQAALRKRRLDEQAPALRVQARNLLDTLDPALAAEVLGRLEEMDGEQLDLTVRHAQAVAEHRAALHQVLSVEDLPVGVRPAEDSVVPASGSRPAGRGPRPGPGQQPVPAELLGLFLESRPLSAGESG